MVFQPPPGRTEYECSWWSHANLPRQRLLSKKSSTDDAVVLSQLTVVHGQAICSSCTCNPSDAPAQDLVATQSFSLGTWGTLRVGITGLNRRRMSPGRISCVYTVTGKNVIYCCFDQSSSISGLNNNSNIHCCYIEVFGLL